MAVGKIVGVVRHDALDWIGDLERLWDEVAGSPGAIQRGGGGQGVTSRRHIGGHDVFCKIYRPDRLHRRLRDRFLGLRCLREWYANCLLSEAGVATAPIVAALAERHGLSIRHLIISVPAAGHPVASWLGGRLGDLPDRAAFLAALAAFVARLHIMGVWHPHLHAKHVFTADGRVFTLIDLDRATLCQPLPFLQRQCNLKQMIKSLRRVGSDADADEFTWEYWKACGLNAGRPPAGEFLRQIVAAAQSVVRQVCPPWRTSKFARITSNSGHGIKHRQ